MLRTLSHAWTIIGHRRRSHSLRPFLYRRGLAYVGRAAVRTVLVWMERSQQRRALAELDDRLLRDIGLTREDALQECANPFWRP
jgi:uncharacterized protein YjiS (DUF1127 family)